MIVEQLIFITAAFALFVYMFYEFIRKNDTKYVPILAIEALRNSNRIYTFIFFKRKFPFTSSWFGSSAKINDGTPIVKNVIKVK